MTKTKSKSKVKELPPLSRGELPIMEYIWEEGETSVGRIWEACMERGHKQSRASVQVRVGRLVDKGWLKRTSEKRPVLYASTKDAAEARFDIANEMTQTLFGSSVSTLVRCLTGGGRKLSQEEMQDLKQMLEESGK